MRRPVFLLLLILLQITLPVKLSGQKPDYRLFDNISLGTEASVINCFLQDTQGLIWIGSNKKGCSVMTVIPRSHISLSPSVTIHRFIAVRW